VSQRIFLSVIALTICTVSNLASAETQWGVSSGRTHLYIDTASLDANALEVVVDGSAPGQGMVRLDVLAAPSVALTSSGSGIANTSGGEVLHTAGISFTNRKSGQTIRFQDLSVRLNGGSSIDGLEIVDPSTGNTVFNVRAVRPVVDGAANALIIEGGDLIPSKHLATQLGLNSMADASFGYMHSRFSLNWTGGDDPGRPVLLGAPRGGNNGTNCNAASGADVIVGDLYPSVSNPSSQQVDGVWIDTFSVGTESCNIGDVSMTWQSGCGTIHPVIGQNCFRYMDGRLEHIGQSWLKHGFSVAWTDECGCGCTGSPSNSMAPGCGDPYGATLNNSQGNIRPKFRVDPTSGNYVCGTNPGTTGSTSRRLQVRHDDIDPTLNSGAQYFVEGHYVHPEDSSSGNWANNASYRPISVSASGTNEYSFSLTGSTQREQAGIRIWQDLDPTVTETDVLVSGNQLFIVASKASDNGDGTWHYEYAVQNLNSDRAMDGFSVPVDPSATITNIGFHDVFYHSGDGQTSATITDQGTSRDGTDWNGVKNGGAVEWTMTDIGLNSNALLWGTMYNFRFDANRAPAATNPDATLDLWRAGSPGSVTAAVQGPEVGPQDCQPNGTEDSIDIANGTSQDCNNDGVPDECQNFTSGNITAELIASGLDRPVAAVAPPGDTNRLFIATQPGQILIYNLNTQTVNGTPFLDISSQTTTSGERGLLGLAFHPNYSSNGRFYINQTNLSGNTEINQYTVSANPDIADAGSKVTLKTIAQDFSNHNAGGIAFSPIDGYLYVPMGDGGSADDPNERAQDDGSLLGKILRLDVDSPGSSYIPPDNPGGSFLPEVWAKGMRNPWRFSFDRLTGDMYIGDVGQGSREEIDFQAAGSTGGQNYGWDCREGFIEAPATDRGCDPNAGGYTDPIFDYVTYSEGTCTVVGGYVYRGCAIPWLNGTYFYADFCADYVRTFRYDGSTISDQQDVTADINDGIPGSLSSPVAFGEDANGELYVISYAGTIYRIIEAGPPPVCGNSVIESGEQCDDGNTNNGDGCSSTCQNEVAECGNGIVELGEECDDGNLVDGDGCDQNCVSENVPGADDCANAPPIVDGTYDIDTTGATTDGVAHPADCTVSGDGGQTYNDIWWTYNAQCDGNLTVTLCGSDYDTDLVIYETCACTPGEADRLGCNDDGCPGSAPAAYRSELTVPVTAGQCYLIRLGGWNTNDSGTGTMTITNDGAPCSDCGNGTIDPGEQCDDGNNTSGDGCSATCMNEITDCNNNGTPDDDDIANGDSPDCNENGTPDECEMPMTGGGTPETKTYPVTAGIAIPDEDATGITSTFTVPDSGTILDVNVGLDISHTYNGDLIIGLTHNGTTVLLRSPQNNINDNGYDVIVDDEGAGGSLGSINLAGGSSLVTSPPSYTPSEALSAFDGMDKQGDWTLSVSDNVGQDTGTLNSWSLIIDNEGTSAPTEDCNNNGVEDVIDMAQGTDPDCNGNCIPDSCDIANDPLLDCDGNGQIDSCELAADPSLDCDGGPLGDPATGATFYSGQPCVSCHAADGTGGAGFPGPNIRGLSRGYIENFLTTAGLHPGGSYLFTQQEFANLEAFLSDSGSRARPDGVLDSCQAAFDDCDNDGTIDACELEAQTQQDLNYDGIPDDCQVTAMGACCNAGNCTVQTETDCINGGGAYQGDDTDCSGVSCPPENDNCADALPLSNGVTIFSTIGATTDGPDEAGTCVKFSDTQVGSDIWYCYTAACTGLLTVSTCDDATYDTKLAIYDGCACPASNILACQDDVTGCGGNTTVVEANVVAGSSYLIRVGGYNGATGTGNLTVTCDAVECIDPIDCDDMDPCTADDCVDGSCVNTPIDTDMDGTPDCDDGCPNDPNKIDPGQCGCGIADDDSDMDGTADCNDNCPNDPNKIEPGDCGCGVADTDSDMDGTPDCDDLCPNDPDKIEPGDCGCGVADDDSDMDGTPDCNDNCPLDPNKIEPGTCGCGEPETAPDGDLNGDGFVNGLDIDALVDGLINGTTTYYNCHGDYDGSGTLDMGDIPGMVAAIMAG